MRKLDSAFGFFSELHIKWESWSKPIFYAKYYFHCLWYIKHLEQSNKKKRSQEISFSFSSWVSILRFYTK